MVVTARVRINVQGAIKYVQAVRSFWDRAGDDILDFAERRGVEILQEEVPKGETMQLHDGCQAERTGKTVRIFSSAPHAEIIDGEGRVPSSPGRYVPAIGRRLVRTSTTNPRIGTHPGAKKTPFGKRTAERLAMELEEEIRRKVRESP